MQSNSATAHLGMASAANGLAPAQPKLMYDKAETAEMLSVSIRTVENLIANKELTVRRIGKRVLIPYTSLIQFIRSDHSTDKDRVN
jgi:excisionase family DNA binding protein